MELFEAIWSYLELFGAIWCYLDLFLLFLLFLFSYFSYISTFPTFPTFLVWSAQGISENISHLGVRDIKSSPSFRPPRLPHWAPFHRSLGGYGVGGSGYSPRITYMILEVNSLPKIFDYKDQNSQSVMHP